MEWVLSGFSVWSFGLVELFVDVCMIEFLTLFWVILSELSDWALEGLIDVVNWVLVLLDLVGSKTQRMERP